MEPAQGPGVAGGGGNSALMKWGPIAALIAVVAIILAVVLSGGGDDEPDAAPDTSVVTEDEDVASTDSGSTDTGGSNTEDPDATDPPAGESTLPDGVMTFAEAERLGLDVDFGDRCDPETGRVKVASFFAPVCYAPFDGDNGGETATGVTEDSIKIVWWQSQADDLVLNYVTDAINNDETNGEIQETIQNLLSYYETYWETYGRSIDLVFYEGSGLVNDAVSARADAVAIAEEEKPFMVIGGPALTNAFAEELNARGVPCIGCGPGQRLDYYTDNSPFAWALGMGPDQSNIISAEFMGKQLVGRPAEFAGDESMHETERVFGRLWIDSGTASEPQNQQFTDEFASYGGEIVESVPYVLDPGTIQESAATAIARLKNSGVTTVILSVDPVAPRDFTREATAQNYFPEWVLGGNVLADTAVFARTYDQDQWRNAFGISTLAARVNPEISGSRTIYQWFFGENPPATKTIGVLTPSMNLLHNYIQAVGPELNMENWRDTIFVADPTASAKTAPSISFGSQGRWPGEFEPDYRGTDDVTLIWWDPDTEGLDEVDANGPGMWQYVDGGQRFLPGAFSEETAAFFDAEGAVAIYNERPADEPVPEYDALPAG